MEEDRHICNMDAVDTGDPDHPAELWLIEGKLWVQVRNQGGYDVAGICLTDLMNWVDAHPGQLKSATASETTPTVSGSQSSKP